ncbi:MAG TPA: glycosyltransferase family 2 protein [Thermoanaerobaculia bacterium]|nr:glycosyltransferase family 2 protein [Thermoanaerobaculia bacterium]
MDPSRPSSASPPELSIVMPCLNEADTLGSCIGKAQRALEASGIVGEIIVADNGSVDGSSEIARRLGAQVVAVEARGYGSALMGGIAAARGRFVVIGDADDSYDFGEVPKLVGKLREGYDLVQGCRLPAGGGTVAPRAMPFLHRWWGNPMFSLMARRWFHAPIHDAYCGLRGFRKDFYQRLDLRCTGMEFATEMIIKSSLQRAKITEVPITLHPDGRTSHPPHLKTFRDGWRTLRFYLMFSPRWLFLYPSLVLVVLGLLGYAVALPGLSVRGITFDAHTLLFASLALLCAFQALIFAISTKLFAIGQGLLPPDPRFERAARIATMEKGVVLGGLSCLTGTLLLLAAVLKWWHTGFGHLEYAVTLRWVIPGVTLFALGVQAVLSSFFLSILGLRRRL